MFYFSTANIIKNVIEESGVVEYFFSREMWGGVQ